MCNKVFQILFSNFQLRPPQPAVYLYLLDVSFNAVETGKIRLSWRCVCVGGRGGGGGGQGQG